MDWNRLDLIHSRLDLIHTRLDLIHWNSPHVDDTEFLEEIQTEILRVFLLAFHSQLYPALPRDFYFFKITQPLTYFYCSVTVLYTVKEKRGKPDRKPYPFPYGLRNSYGNKFEKIMP